jgi:hypothetical protein
MPICDACSPLFSIAHPLARLSALALASLTKEEKTYAQEAEDQKARIERITREGADEWDVKKQVSARREVNREECRRKTTWQRRRCRRPGGCARART